MSENLIKSCCSVVKRERSANWESHEKQLLWELIKPYLNILNNKDNHTVTVRAKQNAWKEITYMYNLRVKTLSGDEKKNYRHKKQILNMWRRIKTSARMKNLMANKTKQGPIHLAKSVNDRETLEIPQELQAFKMESIEFEYECDSVEEAEENPLETSNSVVETIQEDCIPSPPPLINNSQEEAEENPLEISNTVVETKQEDCFPSPLPLKENSQRTEFQVIVEESEKEMKNDIKCKEISTQTSFKKNTNGNKNRNRNVFRFSEEFYEDMRFYRDMENDRMEKEHLLRMKTMEEQHNQVMKNLQLQEELMKKHVYKFS